MRTMPKTAINLPLRQVPPQRKSYPRIVHPSEQEMTFSLPETPLISKRQISCKHYVNVHMVVGIWRGVLLLFQKSDNHFVICKSLGGGEKKIQTFKLLTSFKASAFTLLNYCHQENLALSTFFGNLIFDSFKHTTFDDGSYHTCLILCLNYTFIILGQKWVEFPAPV